MSLVDEFVEHDQVVILHPNERVDGKVDYEIELFGECFPIDARNLDEAAAEEKRIKGRVKDWLRGVLKDFTESAYEIGQKKVEEFL